MASALGKSLVEKMRIPPYAICASIVSMGGFVFGFDTGSIGSVTVMQQFIDTVGELDSKIEGLFVSIILIPAAIVSFGSGSISDRLSRTYATALGCFVYGAGSLIACTAGLGYHHQKSALIQAFVGRAISGAGEGIFLSAVAVYGIEVAPQDKRGRIGCIIQIFISTGIMVAYFICYGSVKIQSSVSWRLPWIIQTIVCFSMAAIVPFLPHSPRWLVQAKRYDEAKAMMRKLGLDERELVITESEPEEREEHSKSKSWQQFKSAFAPEVRGRTLMALFMLGVQQLSGIDGVLYYAPTLFKQAGLSSQSASFLASGVTGIVNVVFTIVGQMLSDRWGRRPALIFGGVIMGAAMTAIGVLYSIPDLPSAGNWAIIVLIFVYFVPFVLTWAILMRIWVSESQPLHSRASVSSLALTVNWICNFIVAFTTPIFLEASPSGPYFLWAACTLIAALVFAAWLPETKGKSIDGDEQDLGLDDNIGWLKEQLQRPPLSRRSTSRTVVATEPEKKTDIEGKTTCVEV
ncbi:general substrate transporter [Cylindrobasidium torrendii FP15055 ss-10]|uniref:General substrate transporter n=1 Tax=Cylindrobasidium torrendii FP15055 ss-10 TaxID=1314674 RepID=A0A0D7B8V6_9AGAR|nr:general substrate transporter [Cylindrobasidium torrendii FP15055 ss-10]